MNSFTSDKDVGRAYKVYELIKSHLPAPLEEKFAFAAPLLYPPKSRGIPWKTRLEMYRHGFQPRAYYIYDFERYGIDAYLSDRNKHEGDLNEPLSDCLKNKRKFHELFDDYGLGRHLPELYGEISGSRVPAADTDYVTLLEREGALVTKGVTGYGGYNVNIFKYEEGEYYINNSKVKKETVRDVARQLDGYLVTEHCIQARYAEELYPNATNTIRLITINPQENEPYIPVAVHRIGTEESGHVDNCSQGGLTAEVKQTGRLSAAGKFVNNDVVWYDTHPDSNAQIKDATVPRWDEMCKTVLSIVNRIKELRYVGWDVLLTESGEFKIIEGNNRSDVDLLQIHRPLLRKKQTREFFIRHGLA